VSHLPLTSLAQAEALYQEGLIALTSGTLEAPEIALQLAHACLEWTTPEACLLLWVQAHLLCIQAHLAYDLGDPTQHERRALQHIYHLYLVLANMAPALALHPC
jgi:hypothetical protein